MEQFFFILNRRGNQRKTVLISSIVIIALLGGLALWPLNLVRAAGEAIAQGVLDTNNNLKGHRVYLYYASSVPSGQEWAAANVGLCDDRACAARFVETGLIKGTGWGMGDNLQQYVTYKDSSGVTQQRFGLRFLNHNTWYQVKSMYSQSAARWEAWLFNDVIWYVSGLGWTHADTAIAMGELANNGDTLYAWGWHPQVQLWSSPSNWNLFNYPLTGSIGDIHWMRAYDYGFGVYAP